MDKKLIGVFEAIQESFQIIQKNLGLFLAVGVGGQVFLTLLASIFFFQFSVEQLILSGLLVFLISIVISTFISMSIILITLKIEKNETVTLEAVFKEAASNFFKFIWLGILLSLVILGGIILLVVPGIIFSVWFFASVFILFEQNKTGFDAMKESKNLVKGHTFEVFTRFLFGILIVIVVSAVIGAFIAPADPNQRPNLISSILQAILSGALGVVGTVYSYVIYRSLKSLKSS